MIRAGVLSLQGSFAPHVRALRELGHEARQVRRPEHLEQLTHLILPGGESTTFRHLMDLYELTAALVEACSNGLRLFATCAGSIVIGRPHAERPARLGLLDVTVERNAYGRQVDSFSDDLDVSCLNDGPFHAIFIRAPRFHEPGPEVEVLARHDGQPVLVHQPRVLAATFHPELTEDGRLHRYFLEEME